VKEFLCILLPGFDDGVTWFRPARGIEFSPGGGGLLDGIPCPKDVEEVRWAVEENLG
jgi:hypothetical protein